MSDVIAKKLDKLTLLLETLKREIPKARAEQAQLKKDIAAVREEVRRLGGPAAAPPEWAARATHPGPPLTQ